MLAEQPSPQCHPVQLLQCTEPKIPQAGSSPVVLLLEPALLEPLREERPWGQHVLHQRVDALCSCHPSARIAVLSHGSQEREDWSTAGAVEHCSAELTHPNPPTGLFQEQWSLTQLLCLCCKSTLCHFINEDKIIYSWDGKTLFFLFCSEVLCQQRPNYVVWFLFCFFFRKKAQKRSLSLFLIT